MGKGGGNSECRRQVGMDAGAALGASASASPTLAPNTAPGLRGQMIEWLRSLPQNAEVLWNEDGMSPSWPIARMSADIHVPELAQAGLSWAWTVESEGSTEAAEAALDPASIDFAHPYQDLLIVPQDPEQPAALVSADGVQLIPEVDQWERNQALWHGQQLDDGSYQLQVWSASGLTRALESWAATQSGRDDIRFRFAPEAGASPMMARAIEAQAQGVKRYQIGEGMYASEQAMDDMLGMPPEIAAQITRALNQVRQQHSE